MRNQGQRRKATRKEASKEGLEGGENGGSVGRKLSFLCSIPSVGIIGSLALRRARLVPRSLETLVIAVSTREALKITFIMEQVTSSEFVPDTTLALARNIRVLCLTSQQLSCANNPSSS